MLRNWLRPAAMWSNIAIFGAIDSIQCRRRWSTSSESPSPQVKVLKSPKTPFRLFVEDHYDTVSVENPGLKRTQLISGVLCRMWQLLPKEEKGYHFEVYELKSAEQTASYKEVLASLTWSQRQEAMDELRAKPGTMTAEKAFRIEQLRRKKLQLAAEYARPKKPPGNGYAQYCAANASLRKGLLLTEANDRLKNGWLSLSDVEKQAYIDKAATASQKYKEEMIEWRSKMVESGQEDIVEATEPLRADEKFLHWASGQMIKSNRGTTDYKLDIEMQQQLTHPESTTDVAALTKLLEQERNKSSQLVQIVQSLRRQVNIMYGKLREAEAQTAELESVINKSKFNLLLTEDEDDIAEGMHETMNRIQGDHC